MGRAAGRHVSRDTGRYSRGVRFRDGLDYGRQIQGKTGIKWGGALRKFHCHLRSISSMATINDLRSNGSPLEGKYMIQEKRINKLVICVKKPFVIPRRGPVEVTTYDGEIVELL